MGAQNTGPLSDPGPIGWMMMGIQERLKAGFPANLFDHAMMPQKADRKWFERNFRRTALVAVGWNGTAAEGEGAVFGGHANFTVALVTKNPKIEGRYLGDALSPGLFGMLRVATLLLNNFVPKSASNSWSASRSSVVTSIGNIYTEEWGDENTAIGALDLSILYEETLVPGLEESPSGSLSLDCGWNFGGADLLTATIGGA
jgi:hypothetical protein